MITLFECRNSLIVQNMSGTFNALSLAGSIPVVECWAHRPGCVWHCGTSHNTCLDCGGREKPLRQWSLEIVHQNLDASGRGDVGRLGKHLRTGPIVPPIGYVSITIETKADLGSDSRLLFPFL